VLNKRTLLLLHRRIGVVAAVFLLLQSASGIAISWRWELARFLDPAGMTGTPTAGGNDIAQVFHRAGEQLPDTDGLRIFFPRDESGVYLLQLETVKGTRYASVNPADGSVLREGSVWRFPVEAALMLHYRPVPGWPGSLYVLVLGLGLTAMIATGFLFWRPPTGRWLARLKLDRKRPPKLMVRQFHRTLGILALPLLLTTAVTGTLLAAEILLGNIGTRAGKPDFSASTFTGLDRVIGEAERAFPGSRVRDLRIANEGTVVVQLTEPGADPWAIHRVTSTLHAPGILDRLPAAKRGGLWPKLLPIHTGSLLGNAGRFVAAGIALVLLVLACIGLYLWMAGIRQRRG